MTDMTPCEERGLKEGQWVWAHDANYGEAAWVVVCTVKTDNLFGCFYPPRQRTLNFFRREIDFTQGVHDEKPSWTPKEYGGEGPPEKFSDTDGALELVSAYAGHNGLKAPITIQRGDYILREDIPDEATFDAVVAECERQGVPRYAYDPSFSKSNKNLTGFTLHDEDKVCCWFTFSRGKDCRRLTPSDLGINTDKPTSDDPHHPDFWRNAPEGATHYAPETKAMASAWFKQGIDGPKVMVDGGTAWCTAAKIPSDAIPRPTSTPRKWDGEGLPPVGTVCDVMYPGTISSDRVQIAGHYKGRVIVAWGQEDDLSCFFAPYGTSFQPVESERERVVKRAHKALNEKVGGWAYELDEHEEIEVLEHLYDAGWLKEPEGE